jgi:hypothetical protein
MDNMLTELKRYSEQMLVHAKVVHAARSQVWWYRLQLWSGLLVLVGAVGALLYRFYTHEYGLWAVLAAGFFFGVLLVRTLVRWRDADVVSHLNAIFERVHALELLTKDQRDELERTCASSRCSLQPLLLCELILSIFPFVVGDATQPTTLNAIERFGLLSFPSLHQTEIAKLKARHSDR